MIDDAIYLLSRYKSTLDPIYLKQTILLLQTEEIYVIDARS